VKNGIQIPMKKMLRDAKSENFVSHRGCGIQYPKCSIETKSAHRRIIDISVFFSNIIQKRNSRGIIFGTQFSQFGCPATIVIERKNQNYQCLSSITGRSKAVSDGKVNDVGLFENMRKKREEREAARLKKMMTVFVEVQMV